jgi:hypothetical protein
MQAGVGWANSVHSCGERWMLLKGLGRPLAEESLGIYYARIGRPVPPGTPR